MEEIMFTRILSGGALAAIAGIVMLGSATSASAFPVSSPALDQPAVGAQIDKVWYDRWGYWHGPHWGPGWGGGGPGPYWGRRCWWRWGHRVCRW
jgi:hypothetical protein